VDRRLLESRIAARHASGGDKSIIGFYRSHTRRNFAVTIEDAALFSTYFRKASDVFLLIKANDDGPPTAGFLLRDVGKDLSGGPGATFALDRTMFGEPPREMPAPLPLPAAAPEPVAAAAPRVLSRVRPSVLPWKAPLERWPLWVAIGVGAVLLISIPLGRRPAEQVPSLALNVANTGANLRLSWDHQASRRAGHAILWIQDGQDEHRFDLDAKQLGEGSVSYWPNSSDVNFRMEWMSSAGKVTESVRAIGGPALVHAASPSPIPVALPPQPAPRAELTETRDTGAIAAALPARRESRRRETGSASRQRSRAFTVPQPESVSPTPARTALPEPPAVLQVASLPPDNGSRILQTLAPLDDAGSHTTADSSYRIEIQPLPRMGRNIPLIGKRTPRNDYTPPAPLHQAALPSLPRRDDARELDLDVKVYVNPTGKVDYAELLSNVSKVNRDLAALLVFSARRWEFVPAREAQEDVPGEVILHYRFAPQTRAVAR
jgi:hypothetical protein